MPKAERGVHQRSKSKIWQWRIKAPKDLLHLYPSEWAHRCSLGTYSLPEANTKAARLRAEWLERFAHVRKGICPPHSLIPSQSCAAEQQRFVEALQANESSPTLLDASDTFARYVDIIKTALRAELTEPRTEPALKRSLRYVYGRWITSDPSRRKDSHRACQLALTLFEKQYPDKAADITTITRTVGDEFKAWLQMPERGTKAKTARDRFNWLKTLLKYAHQDLELLPKQPWVGLEIKFKRDTRKPWTLDQVKAFYSQPLFATYSLPNKAKRAGADAAYWLPLLGLFTGARLGELCQLHASDIAEHEGVWCIDINGEGNKLLKTQASARKIPIHSELIRLGFLEYASDIKQAKLERLWPKLHLNDEKPSLGFSRWFNEVPRRAIKDTVIPDFHSLRHTARSLMASARVPVTTQDRITGHESTGSVGTIVYTHVPMRDLQEAVEAIRYPGFSLARAYPITHS